MPSDIADFKGGSIPIIGMEPAVKPAVEHTHESGRRVMVVSTPVTAKGEKLKKLVDKYDDKHIVDVVALPKLVRFAQDDDFDSENGKGAGLLLHEELEMDGIFM